MLQPFQERFLKICLDSAVERLTIVPDRMSVLAVHAPPAATSGDSMPWEA